MAEVATIQAALMWGRAQLAPFSESAGSDPRVVLAHLLERDSAWLLAHPDDPLPDDIQHRYLQALERLCTGEPLPYVVGHWEFYGRRFQVSPSVLIPRPETERMIEICLDFIDRRAPDRVADIGTGSGCIAVTLAAERPALRILATDRSRAALMIAKGNAAFHSVGEQIYWMQGDLLEPISTRFDLVVANLPYIPSSRLSQLPVAEHEPQLALDGGEMGLDLIKRLIMDLPKHLGNKGMVLLEIDESHGKNVVEFAKSYLPAADIHLLADLAGLDRYVSIKFGMDR